MTLHRHAFIEAHQRERAARQLLEKQAAAREAAETEAARAKEAASNALQAVAAAEAAALRVKAFSSLPPAYFELPSQLRELLENAVFQAHAAEAEALRPLDLATAALCIEKPNELYQIWAADGSAAEHERAIQVKVGTLPSHDLP